jgi:hypothetical protein
MMFLGQSLFVLCFGITRILFIVSDYFSPDLPPEIVLFPDPNLNFLFWKLSALIGILAIIFLLLVIETYLVKISHFIFSGTATAGLIIALVSQDIDFSRLVTYVTLPFAMIGLISLYAYLFFKSSGEIRKKSTLSLDGLIIFGIGVVLDTNYGKSLLADWFGFFPSFIPIIFIIVGLGIYTYFNIKE